MGVSPPCGGLGLGYYAHPPSVVRTSPRRRRLFCPLSFSLIARPEEGNEHVPRFFEPIDPADSPDSSIFFFPGLCQEGQVPVSCRRAGRRALPCFPSLDLRPASYLSPAGHPRTRAPSSDFREAALFGGLPPKQGSDRWLQLVAVTVSTPGDWGFGCRGQRPFGPMFVPSHFVP